MPASPATTLKQLKAFGLSLPGTQPKSPWPGHDDVAVNNKTFAYLSADGAALSVSVKLPVSGKEVLRLPTATPHGLRPGQKRLGDGGVPGRGAAASHHRHAQAMDAGELPGPGTEAPGAAIGSGAAVGQGGPTA